MAMCTLHGSNDKTYLVAELVERFCRVMSVRTALFQRSARQFSLIGASTTGAGS